MKNLSWTLRILIVMIAFFALWAIGVGVYYTVVRMDRNQPLDIDPYPDTELITEETLMEGRDRLLFSNPVNATDYETVLARAMDIERFYEERGYDCRTGYGDQDVNGQMQNDIYINSRCIYDRIHDLGFEQFNTIVIQPDRDWGNTNALTGVILIDVRREWDGSGLLGG